MNKLLTKAIFNQQFPTDLAASQQLNHLLLELIVQLEQRVTELEEKAGSSSRNSSKPPSQDSPSSVLSVRRNLKVHVKKALNWVIKVTNAHWSMHPPLINSFTTILIPSVAHLPAGTVPRGQMGPRLISWITLMNGSYALSVTGIKRLLKDQWQLEFSTEYECGESGAPFRDGVVIAALSASGASCA